MSVCAPPSCGVYVTEQAPPLRVQLVLLNVPPLLGLAAQLIVPVGALEGPESVSLTEAVQVSRSPALATAPGAQTTDVLVDRFATVTNLVGAPEAGSMI